MQPLVTIICLCFNHARFLREALDSVLAQSYPNLEIIVADDFSTDNSRDIISEYVRKYPQLIYLPSEKNLGNCAAFNRAFAISKGEFIIDFGTDDVLMPERVAEQVAAFQQLDGTYGVIYTDAELIDEASNSLGKYYKRDSSGKTLKPTPSGEVFAQVVARHFISTPTMMMRRSVFEKLGGYDATLAYEDFDFWVRSARSFNYFFLDKPLTKRRIHPAQMSQQQYKPHDKQLLSTIVVCHKVKEMLRNETEKSALVDRVQYELKQSVFSGNAKATRQLYFLLEELGPVSLKFKFLKFMADLPLPLAAFRRIYYRLRA